MKNKARKLMVNCTFHIMPDNYLPLTVKALGN